MRYTVHCYSANAHYSTNISYFCHWMGNDVYSHLCHRIIENGFAWQVLSVTCDMVNLSNTHESDLSSQSWSRARLYAVRVKNDKLVVIDGTWRRYSVSQWFSLTSSGAGLSKREWEKAINDVCLRSAQKCTYLDANGGNVGGGAIIELGISLPVIPIPCNCSGRNDVDALNPPPRPPIF